MENQATAEKERRKRKKDPSAPSQINEPNTTSSTAFSRKGAVGSEWTNSNLMRWEGGRVGGLKGLH